MTRRQTWHPYPPELDAFLKPRGPCGFCATPDARHRLVDAISEQVRAGDWIREVAWNNSLSVEAVEYIAALPDGWRP